MGAGFRITRIAGIEIYVDWSLLIIFFLIAFSLGSGLFPLWHPDWSMALSWLTALSAAVLFFIAVLMHELSHALMGRRHGVDVKRITLFLFGGVAMLENEPRNWRAEFLIAVVGPLTSLVIGAVCITLAVYAAGPDAIDPNNIERTMASFGAVATLLLWLGQINILLVLFNLVPGFPLDGGRMLRAVLWGITGDLQRATRWASGAGQIFAWYFIATGIAMMLGLRVPIFGTGFVSGLWLSLIGWFLYSAALVSYRQLMIKESLENIPLNKLMQTKFLSVPPELTIKQLVDDYLLRSDQVGFPVIKDDRLVGMVGMEDIRKAERTTWESKAISRIMTPIESLAKFSPQDSAHKALSSFGKGKPSQLPILEDNKLRGLLRREDILKWLSLYSNMDMKGTTTLGPTH